MRRTLAAALLLGAVGVGLAALPGSADVAPEPRGQAPAEPRRPPDRPNIVLVVTDDQPPDTARMPYLSSRPDWVTFTNAQDEVALCCPARSTILTGQYSTHTGVVSNAAPGDGRALDETSTLPVWLRAAGYRTALVGKYLNSYPWTRGPYVPPGWDDWHAFHFRTSYYGYRLNSDGVVVARGTAPEDYSTDVLNELALGVVRDAQASPQPFFLYYAPFAPHAPYQPSPRHAGAFAGERVPRPPSFNEADVSDKPAFVQALAKPSPSVLDNARRSSWAMALSVDDFLRDLDATLAAAGELDNTVVVVTSDNGFAFGEHRWKGKRCQYDACQRVPLLLRLPGRPGRTVPQLAQDVDLAPTVTELAGATPTRVFDGRSLLPLADGDATGWRTSILQRHVGTGTVRQGEPPEFWAVRTDRYRWVELATGERELYDYAVDPYELQNRAGDPAYAQVRGELEAELARLRAEASRPAVAAGG